MSKRDLIGRLDRRIEFHERTYPTAADGQRVEGYQLRGSCWARLMEPAGREDRQAAAKRERRIREFEIRYNADIKITDRLHFGTEEHDIIDIRELPQYGRRARMMVRAEYIEP